MQNDEAQQKLQQLAYESWCSRGCPVGSPEVDWEYACRVLSAQLTRVDRPTNAGTNSDPAFEELGSDEDTAGDAQSVSPFEAAADVDIPNVKGRTARSEEPVKARIETKITTRKPRRTPAK